LRRLTHAALTHRMAAPGSPIRSLWVHCPVAQQAGGRWVDDILHAQTAAVPGHAVGAARAPRQRVELIRAADPEDELNRSFYVRRWTDGLPVVPPTVHRVREMLRYCSAPAGEVIAELEPMRGEVTPEKIAINAVMAGCRPEYFPVVLAAVRALAEPAFNLRGVQMTDENVAPLLIVSGPLVSQLAINAGIGALGPGWQANATLGRAIRLIMQNIGGGWPGVTSLAGIGQPGRYTLCVGEAPSPWPQLTQDANLPAGTSAVTLLRAESCINVTGGLTEIASVMGSAASAFSMLHGGCVAVLLAPATAAALAETGYSKHDVQEQLFRSGRVPVHLWREMWVRQKIAPRYGVPAWVSAAEAAQEPIPVVQRPQDIVVFVAGGLAPIAQHVYFPTWGFPYCRVTRAIALPHDWPAQHFH